MKKIKGFAITICLVMVVALYGLLVLIYIEQSSAMDNTAPSQNISTTLDSTVPEESEPEYSEPSEPEPTEPTVPKDPWQATLTLPQNSNLTSKNTFVFDVTNNQLLLETGGVDQRIYPASVTKLFTAYVALQLLDPTQQVTAGSELRLVGQNSSVAGIRSGYILTVAQLVEAMLLPSGNDAAYVLACAAGRAIAQDPNMDYRQAVSLFVAQMNISAQALGLSGSHFSNPDGYHAAEHYTTPRDLIAIARLALSNTYISSSTARESHTVTFVSGQTKTWTNTNALVDPDSKYYTASAVGLKTGYTYQAGNCLIAAFRVGGRELIIGAMGCPTKSGRFADVLYLLGLATA